MLQTSGTRNPTQVEVESPPAHRHQGSIHSREKESEYPECARPDSDAFSNAYQHHHYSVRNRAQEGESVEPARPDNHDSSIKDHPRSHRSRGKDSEHAECARPDSDASSFAYQHHHDSVRNRGKQRESVEPARGKDSEYTECARPDSDDASGAFQHPQSSLRSRNKHHESSESFTTEGDTRTPGHIAAAANSKHTHGDDHDIRSTIAHRHNNDGGTMSQHFAAATSRSTREDDNDDDVREDANETTNNTSSNTDNNNGTMSRHLAAANSTITCESPQNAPEHETEHEAEHNKAWADSRERYMNPYSEARYSERTPSHEKQAAKSDEDELIHASSQKRQKQSKKPKSHNVGGQSTTQNPAIVHEVLHRATNVLLRRTRTKLLRHVWNTLHAHLHRRATQRLRAADVLAKKLHMYMYSTWRNWREHVLRRALTAAAISSANTTFSKLAFRRFYEATRACAHTRRAVNIISRAWRHGRITHGFAAMRAHTSRRRRINRRVTNISNKHNKNLMSIALSLWATARRQAKACKSRCVHARRSLLRRVYAVFVNATQRAKRVRRYRDRYALSHACRVREQAWCTWRIRVRQARIFRGKIACRSLHVARQAFWTWVGVLLRGKPRRDHSSVREPMVEFSSRGFLNDETETQVLSRNAHTCTMQAGSRGKDTKQHCPDSESALSNQKQTHLCQFHAGIHDRHKMILKQSIHMAWVRACRVTVSLCWRAWAAYTHNQNVVSALLATARNKAHAEMKSVCWRGWAAYTRSQKGVQKLIVTSRNNADAVLVDVSWRAWAAATRQNSSLSRVLFNNGAKGRMAAYFDQWAAVVRRNAEFVKVSCA
jgi:hypothetical protein